MASLPETCKAACVHEPGQNFRVVVEDVSVPQPGRGEILIKLNATGLCYSDIHYMMEDLPLGKMSDRGVRSPGHEGVGTVVQVGEGVTNWSNGDRAGVKPAWSTCGHCQLCTSDREMFCSGCLQTGLHKTGTYQQYIVAAADHAIHIPDGIEDHVAAPILCSGATIYRAITESQVKPGEWIVISGAGGGVGHMGIQYAKAMGMRVIAIDGGAEKGGFCLELGATAYVDFRETKDVAAEVVRLTDGQGAHGVIVTAGNAAAYNNVLPMLRIGGVIMGIGLPPSGSANVGGDPLLIIFKNLRITGTIIGTRSDVVKALGFVQQGLVKPVVQVYALKDIEWAVYKLKRGEVQGRGVVLFEGSD